jgi:hypothetical protein
MNVLDATAQCNVARHAVLKMVNENGKPEVSKVAMLKVVQELERAAHDLALAQAREALGRIK